jgi:peptide chain release factor 2
MYVKYAERQGFGIFVVHQNQNDHGGFRNITFVVQGRGRAYRQAGAYGILKSESGVHRLVRLSPFNAKKLRHTSFALVEVIPDFPRDAEIKIDSRDLKIEFFRSSGPGGQNVNKRETAVRIIHLPTCLAAHSEAERSQERNRERARSILQGKLYKREEERRATQERGMQISKTTEIAWGNQIRSYVLHPYKLVKDHRTGVESRDAEGVLNGEIDIFLKAQS